jgi:hypothetical protein
MEASGVFRLRYGGRIKVGLRAEASGVGMVMRGAGVQCRCRSATLLDSRSDMFGLEGATSN